MTRPLRTRLPSELGFHDCLAEASPFKAKYGLEMDKHGGHVGGRWNQGDGPHALEEDLDQQTLASHVQPIFLEAGHQRQAEGSRGDYHYELFVFFAGDCGELL